MSGLRDRALMATMVYSFARIGVVLAMKVEDYYRADSPDKLEQVTEHPLSAPLRTVAGRPLVPKPPRRRR